MKGQMPWFPFWVRDFLTSRTVARMSMEEVGVYVLLLCHEWEDGPLPDDPEALSRLIRADVNIVRTVLEQCFHLVHGSFVNDRLECVREEQLERYEKRAKAGRASGRARRKSKGGNDNEHRSNNVRTNSEHTDTDTEEKTPSESKSATAAAVGDFLMAHDLPWKLNASINEWSAGIERDPRYAGVDHPHEIRRCSEWYMDAGKSLKSPTNAIHNWLKKAAEDVRKKPRGGGQQWIEMNGRLVSVR